MIPNDSHETAREPIMPIDWNDDETVVRAAIPIAYVTPAGCINTNARIDGTMGGSWTLADNWHEARKHPAVVAFEKANRRREPITAEICNTCLHPEHEGQCRATAACLCIQFPSLHPNAPVDLPVQEAAGDGQAEIIRCPFCNEDDFDLIGLKLHLPDCETHEKLAIPPRAAWTACAERGKQ